MTIVGIAVAARSERSRYGLDGLVSDRAAGRSRGGRSSQPQRRVSARARLHALTERWAAEPTLRSALTIGFLGAYTTLSTLSFGSYRLLEDGAIWLAAANLLGSCAAGLAAVCLGVVAGRVL